MCDVLLTIVFAIIGLAVVGPIVVYLYRWLASLVHILELKRSRLRRGDGRSGTYERATLKLGVASIRANVLALLLISLVGLAQLGFEIWRYNSGEKTYLTSALEELLQKKLLDPETQQRQHQEIVNVIRGVTISGDGSLQPKIDELFLKLFVMQEQLDRHEEAIKGKPPDRADTPNGDNFFRGLFIAVCAAPGIWAIFYFLRSMNALSAKQYRIARAAVVSVGSIAGGGTLFHEVSLVKKLDSFIKVEVKGGYSGSEITRGPRGYRGERGLRGPRGQPGSSILLPTEISCGTGDSQRIQPFVGGDEIPEEMAISKLNEVVKVLREHSQSHNLLGFVLIGSADKRPLKPERKQKYGSNTGLAQARIKKVSRELVREFPDKPIMAVHAGPSNTGLTLSENELAFDRAVQVCAFWSPKS